MHFMRREVSGSQSRTNTIQHSRQNERQRLDRHNFVIQFHDVDEPHPIHVRDKRTRTHTPSSFVQFDTFLSKPSRNVHGRQFRKRAQPAYAPTLQSFQNFRRSRKNGRRKIGKPVGFRAVIENGDAAESARRANGCINIGCKSYIRFEPTRACGFGNLGCNFRIRPE